MEHGVILVADVWSDVTCRTYSLLSLFYDHLLLHSIDWKLILPHHRLHDQRNAKPLHNLRTNTRKSISQIFIWLCVLRGVISQYDRRREDPRNQPPDPKSSDPWAVSGHVGLCRLPPLQLIYARVRRHLSVTKEETLVDTTDRRAFFSASASRVDRRRMPCHQTYSVRSSETVGIDDCS